MHGNRRLWLVAALVTLVVGAGCGLGGKDEDKAAVPVDVQVTATTDSPFTAGAS